jgi:hypothetical protein
MWIHTGIMLERPLKQSHWRGKQDTVLPIETPTGSLHGQSVREQREVFLDNLGVTIRSAESVKVGAIQVWTAC